MHTATSVPYKDALEKILARYEKSPENVLQICIELQEQIHCVPVEAQAEIAKAMGVTKLRLRGVVSFYTFLSATFLGDYVIYISDNIVDQMAGNRAIGERFCRKLGVKIGEVRADGRVSVHYASCTGMCDQGPAGLVNGQAITQLTAERVDQIVDLIEAKKPLSQWPKELFKVVTNIRRSDAVFRNPVKPGEGIKAVLALGDKNQTPVQDELRPEDTGRNRLDKISEEIVKMMHTSNLRGRGGAGFKSAIKWDAVRNQKGREHFVLCNADEGEPGTFKDRVILMDYPDMVIEGMTIAGLGVKADHGIIYLRGEYRYMKDFLEGVLKRRRDAGLLGKNILGSGFDFDVKIHWGAGAYICGMETATCKSIEGRRGIPRRRWPLPVTEGFRKKPTLVNNVESYACASAIALKGGEWFASLGTPQSTGSKWFCISGDVDFPGAYEYPLGISIREILRDTGARDPQALQVSGASGYMIHESEFDRMLAFEDLPCVGTIMVIGRNRDLFDTVCNFAHFFQHESCGLCTPCRVGTTLLVKLLDKFKKGWGTPLDLEEAKLIANTMKLGAHCGLGQTASCHFIDAINKFPHVFESRMQSKEFLPAFNLDGALDEARQLANRTDEAAHVH